jgi:hypothetical protein
MRDKTISLDFAKPLIFHSEWRDITIVEKSGNSQPLVDRGCRRNVESFTVRSDPDRAFRPARFHSGQPPGNGAPKVPRPEVIRRTELHLKPSLSEQPNPLICARQVAAPSEPQVEVETTGRVGKTPNDVQFAGYGVGADLLPKPFAEFNAIR